MFRRIAVLSGLAACHVPALAPQVVSPLEDPVVSPLLLTLTPARPIVAPFEPTEVEIRLSNTGSQPFYLHRAGFEVGLDVGLVLTRTVGVPVELGPSIGIEPVAGGAATAPLAPGESLVLQVDVAPFLSGMLFTPDEEMTLHAEYFSDRTLALAHGTTPGRAPAVRTAPVVLSYQED
jgi:hypothetical protein